MDLQFFQVTSGIVDINFNALLLYKNGGGFIDCLLIAVNL